MYSDQPTIPSSVVILRNELTRQPASQCRSSTLTIFICHLLDNAIDVIRRPRIVPDCRPREEGGGLVWSAAEDPSPRLSGYLPLRPSRGVGILYKHHGDHSVSTDRFPRHKIDTDRQGCRNPLRLR